MRLSSRNLSALINFLLGVFWALAFLGSLSALSVFQYAGILSSLVFAFLWGLPGIFGVLVMEYLLAGFERTEEIKKQTRLLEELLRRDEKDFPPS